MAHDAAFRNHNLTHPSTKFGEIPLSLYIHIPWCVKKCPYCDFNSHAKHGAMPIEAYVSALLDDLRQDLAYVQGRELKSIFFGGGTPSLFPAKAIAEILNGANQHVSFASDIEITLECNPGTAEYCDFGDLRAGGVNRLSFGAQSFHDAHLATLGRIHKSDEIDLAISKAANSGFTNYNIDLMHGLPQQSPEQALNDLERAIRLEPTHVSWYQLTIEPNTAFYSARPSLPEDDILADIQDAGQAFLAEHGFKQYEVSAYAKPNKVSLHNLNYWEFGDYLGIGAGAHGKITTPSSGEIWRYQKTRLPEHYLDITRAFTSKKTCLPPEALPLEFMMNALRLREGLEQEKFEQRCALPLSEIETSIAKGIAKGLLVLDNATIRTTDAGYRFLNEALQCFQ